MEGAPPRPPHDRNGRLRRRPRGGGAARGPRGGHAPRTSRASRRRSERLPRAPRQELADGDDGDVGNTTPPATRKGPRDPTGTTPRRSVPRRSAAGSWSARTAGDGASIAPCTRAWRAPFRACLPPVRLPPARELDLAGYVLERRARGDGRGRGGRASVDRFCPVADGRSAARPGGARPPGGAPGRAPWTSGGILESESAGEPAARVR